LLQNQVYFCYNSVNFFGWPARIGGDRLLIVGRIGTIITEGTEFTHPITIILILHEEGFLARKAHPRNEGFTGVNVRGGEGILNEGARLVEVPTELLNENIGLATAEGANASHSYKFHFTTLLSFNTIIIPHL
jgi:hypothetical protein